MTPNEKPASPTQGELAVKALEWKPHGGDGIMSIRADAIGLRYYIFENEDGLWQAYTEGYMMERFGEHKTKDEAKAAVQIGHDRRILSTLDRTTLPPTWLPTHKHVKRGSTYRLDGYGEVQTDTPLNDYAKVAIYRAEDGTTWVRPVSEFEDGRFEALSAPQGTRS
jgi:hypothetical protein